jgi:chromosome segregation ATPase
MWSNRDGAHDLPETIPPTDRAKLDAAVAAIGKDPSTLAVLYVHQLMALEAMESHMRVLDAELADARQRATTAEAALDECREQVRRAKERIDVLGGAA